jgi:ATP-dependent Lhr-like helicase
VRDADDLADALQTLVALPAAHGDAWRVQFDELAAARRAAEVYVGDRTYWVAAERAHLFATLFPDARWEATLPDLAMPAATRDEALTQLARGWLSHTGPTTAAALADRLGLPAEDIEAALLRLESEGSVLRGAFTPLPSALRPLPSDLPSALRPLHSVEWCDRRLLARIHRLTLGKLRREIEPVAAADFMRWLVAWQHVEPGTQVVGERGLIDVLRQLQGFEAPASAWESQILRRRVLNYDPAWLDHLCLTGAIGWGRLSPHPAVFEVAGGTGRRVVPTSAAPITFFVRDDADWMAPKGPVDSSAPGDGPPAVPGLSRNAGAVLAWLHRSGASFFPDIVRGVKLLKAEVEAALWELVTAGLVTADGFDNLRALIDPRRRAGQGSGRTARPRHSTGRWSLLHAGAAVGRAEQIEATCRMLLARYGVVCRELLARESLLPTWRELLITFRRLEDRGEVRGGRFVSGLVGEQFALPLAVESLRASRRRPHAGAPVTISAADPLNLVGLILPGERVPAISGKTIEIGSLGAAMAARA